MMRVLYKGSMSNESQASTMYNITKIGAIMKRFMQISASNKEFVKKNPKSSSVSK